MADTLDALIRVIQTQDGEESRFQASKSALTIGESYWQKLIVATNTTVEVGDLGAMGSTSLSDKIIAIENSASGTLNVRFSTGVATGQLPLHAGGFFLAYTTSVTGLHLNNPHTTDTRTVWVGIWDT